LTVRIGERVSNARPRTDPVLKELKKEKYHTERAIEQLNNEVLKMKNGRPIVMPEGFTNYTDFLKRRTQLGYAKNDICKKS